MVYFPSRIVGLITIEVVCEKSISFLSGKGLNMYARIKLNPVIPITRMMNPIIEILE